MRPRRFPKNVEGPFYGTGNCPACGLPETEAPDLLAPVNDDHVYTYFVQQPATPEQAEAACWALKVCCVSALRYGGTDVEIIKRLGNDRKYCDYILDRTGTPKPAFGKVAFLRRLVDRILKS